MTSPSHKHLPTGAIVFPQGYPPQDLARLTKADRQAHSDELTLAHLRQERDARLADSDKMMLPDRGFDPATVAAWAEYRAALRDITGGDIHKPNWPSAPDQEKQT